MTDDRDRVMRIIMGRRGDALGDGVRGDNRLSLDLGWLGRGQNTNRANQSDSAETYNYLTGGAPTKLAQGVRRIVETRHQYISIHQRQDEHNRYESYLGEEQRLIGR